MSIATAKGRLAAGKVPWQIVQRHLDRVLPAEVVLGPRFGEDAALVRLGQEIWAVAADPISFTSTEAGRLAVHVNANDVAVMGGRPTFFVATVLVAPGEATKARVDALLAQIRETCDSLGVALIGGHTEVTPGLPHSMIAGTMLGPVRRPLPTGGLQPGDRIGMTRWAAMEGTAILQAELGPRLRALGLDLAQTDADSAPAFEISIVREAQIAAGIAEVSALHDVTEGGVAAAVREMAAASGCGATLDVEAVALLPRTRQICEALSLDPLGLLGSGALLIGCRPAGSASLARALAEAAIPLHWIGEATGDGTPEARSARDEILKVWALQGVGALVFDLDGTIVDSHYDWPAIRGQLGIADFSILDALQRLPAAERLRKRALLEEIEGRATADATIYDGVTELLELAGQRGLRLGLVTNNTATNTGSLLDRFGLTFEAVVTRDSGMWKPSAAPLLEVARQLGVAPERCALVGDSPQDAAAGDEAGYQAVAIVHRPGEAFARAADLAFDDIAALTRYLQLVL